MPIPLIARIACLVMVPYLLTHGAPAHKAIPAEHLSFSISAHGLALVLARGEIDAQTE
ncbi:hypothetical protein HZF05_08355 [Sphingomonas sp. CGMCC 1.13654]|uniref:Uncharacterized protein n=1 Tax=Sphingomonas chungangi TaxID=2683589 RepID=A0A838L403_9SPHN|nr:hypothetical protein [Sphingomonas chungangi]MBA2934111.1 hypothetical protein [Sphingomonas chungangi]MVW57152.1 hypothetical protein [Sphingomonas chungangi]